MNALDKAIKMMDAFEVTADLVKECLQDYRQEAFGFNGIEDWVKTQYPRHPDSFKKELIKRMKKGK